MRSRFDTGLRFSFFLIEITGQKFNYACQKWQRPFAKGTTASPSSVYRFFLFTLSVLCKMKTSNKLINYKKKFPSSVYPFPYSPFNLCLRVNSFCFLLPIRFIF